MSETTSEKPNAGRDSAPKPKPAAEKYFADLHGDGKLTRIPVAHLYFPVDAQLDIPGESQISNKACQRFENKPGRYFVCDFIPAWQTFELSFVVSPDTTPTTLMLPATYVSRWKRLA